MTPVTIKLPLYMASLVTFVAFFLMGKDVTVTACIDGSGVTFTDGARDVDAGEKVGAITVASDGIKVISTGDEDGLESDGEVVNGVTLVGTNVLEMSLGAIVDDMLGSGLTTVVGLGESDMIIGATVDDMLGSGITSVVGVAESEMTKVGFIVSGAIGKATAGLGTRGVRGDDWVIPVQSSSHSPLWVSSVILLAVHWA